MTAEGWWVRYGCKRVRVFPVDDHEAWLRADGGRNARLLGLPDEFLDTNGGLAREELLLLAMKTTQVMRVRGHHHYVTFEYWNAQDGEAFHAIRRWGKKLGAGDVLLLNIVNLSGRAFRPMWLVFEQAVRNGQPVQAVPGCRLP